MISHSVWANGHHTAGEPSRVAVVPGITVLAHRTGETFVVDPAGPLASGRVLR